MLEQGHQIYQGPAKNIRSYLDEQLGCAMGQFQNPADYIIKLAQAPHLCNPTLNLATLVATYDRVLRPSIDKGIKMRASRYQTIDTNFMDFAENRGASFSRQVEQIYIRNLKFLLRHRSAIIGLVVSNIFSALLNISVYWNIGYFPDLAGIYFDHGAEEAQARYARFVLDLTGIAFLFSNQFSISSSFDAVMQVPLQTPVMKRELASNMYSPLAYYLGRFLSHLAQIMLIPVTMVPIMFWAIGIDTSFDSFCWVFGIATASGFVFCAQGFFWGLLISDEEQVQQANVFCVMLFVTTNGCLVNLRQANWFIKALGAISPARLSCEAFFRTMSVQIYPVKFFRIEADRQAILDDRGFNYGRGGCAFGLVVWLLVWVLATVAVVHLKLRRS